MTYTCNMCRRPFADAHAVDRENVCALDLNGWLHASHYRIAHDILHDAAYRLVRDIDSAGATYEHLDDLRRLIAL